MQLTAEDRLDLHEVIARLDHYVDSANWDAYVALFAEDGVMAAPWGDPVQGRQAIRDWLAANEGGTSGKRHVASNVVIDMASGEVRAVHYLTVIEREEAARVVATAVVTQTFAKADGGWLVKRHEVAVDPSAMA